VAAADLLNVESLAAVLATTTVPIDAWITVVAGELGSVDLTDRVADSVVWQPPWLW
jgi:hypothetical protein